PGPQQNLRFWDAETGQPQTMSHDFGPGGVFSGAFSPDGKIIAAAAAGRIELCDTSTGTVLRTIPYSGFQRDTATLFWSNDGKTLVCSHGLFETGLGGGVAIDVASGETIWKIGAYPSMQIASWSQDGSQLASLEFFPASMESGSPPSPSWYSVRSWDL